MREILAILLFSLLAFLLIFKLSHVQAADSSTDIQPFPTTPKELRCYNSYGGGADWNPLWSASSDMRYMTIDCYDNQVNTHCDLAGYIVVGFVYDSGGMWGSPTCKIECAQTNTGPGICDWK